MTILARSEVKNKAYEVAAEYCKKRGFSIEKLSQLSIFVLEDSVAFATKPEYYGGGLLEDLSSRPKSVLFVNRETGQVKLTQLAYEVL